MKNDAHRNKELAEQLLDWNRRNLRHDVELSQSLIAERFAPEFQVFANGRSYAADHESYQGFLQGFKSSIASIDYEVTQIVADEAGVVLAMRARVERVNAVRDQFEAMLLLRFDEQGKLVLWHEVYVQSQAV
ncbi:hypothetical protein [Comamonas composti]|uniref:hypothetical protein n=1 Tax=Comamonas composti TaxID=408558 RepID=UPI00041AD671|nr:hypothetical protein [Comamonas composti]